MPTALKFAYLQQIHDHTIMESKRQKQFSRLIQKDLGEIFQREVGPALGGVFITVTHVKMTPDLSIAKVYLSLMLAKDQEAVMRYIDEQTSHIRMVLGQRIRHQVRKIPELDFYLDNTQEEVERIEKLFENLDIPPKEQDKDSE